MALAFSHITVETTADFEHAVAQIPDSSLHNVTSIVLRVHVRLWFELLEKKYDAASLAAHIAAVCTRAPNVDILVLIDSHSAAESRLPSISLQGPYHLVDGKNQSFVFRPVSEDLLTEIRNEELVKIFEAGRSRCVTCASANYHFALPSGAHASQFLRLGDAFTDIETVDRVAYWIAIQIQSRIPVMDQDARFALMVDHPSMLIMAARVQLLVPVSIEIVAFPTYPSDIQARTAAFDLLTQVKARSTSVFVAIGVASTGRLAGVIQQWAANQSPATEVNVVILYATQKLPQLAPAQIMCQLDLSDYKHYESATSCDLCTAQSAPVQIQSSSYLVGHAPNEAAILKIGYFDQQRDFIQKWGHHEGVLRVHYDDPNESTARHHSFYVDVGTLLEIPEFRKDVIDEALRFDPQPDVVTVPDHPRALQIGRLIADAIKRPLVILDAALVSKNEGQIDSRLYDAKCALVVDDVFITGTRLQNINGFFRERRKARSPNLQRIHFWTLLATVASETQYKRTTNGMILNHEWKSTFSHLHKLTLPNWHDTANCPWCMELKVLQGVAQASTQFEGAIVNRLSVLGSTRSGITEDPFFMIDGTQLPYLGAQSVALREGSTPMQVLFACASALQQLRQSDQQPLDADQFPAPTFLAERNFSTNYRERLIWLGMLRSIKNKELDPLLRDFLAGTALDETDGQRPLVQGELAVAWLSGKLGAIQVSHVSQRFFASSGISWDSLFAKVLVDRHPS